MSIVKDPDLEKAYKDFEHFGVMTELTGGQIVAMLLDFHRRLEKLEADYRRRQEDFAGRVRNWYGS